MTLTRFETLKEGFSWTKWRKIETKKGPRNVRSATVPYPADEFWEIWKTDGAQIKALGFSLSKYQESWQLTEWRTVDGGQTEQAKYFEEQHQEEIRAMNWIPEGIEVPEEIKSKLLSFQPNSVARIVHALQKHGSALDGSDMGTGKTFTAIAAAMMMNLRPAVVCPIAVIPSWKRALNHFGVSNNMVMNYEKLRTGNTSFGRWQKEEGKRSETFKWNLPEDSLVIFDEIQKTKSADSLNCKMGLGALSQGYKILGCSGTIASNPMEMRFSGEIARLHSGKDFFGWMRANGVIKNRFGHVFTGGQGVLQRIRTKIYPEHGTRLRKDDLPGFPECDIQAEAYDCGSNTKAIEGVYDQMLGKLAEIESDGSLSAIEKKANTLAEITAARMEAEKLKLPAIKDLADEFQEEGNSVVIFTNYRESIALLKDMIKTDCIVQGGQSPEVRESNIGKFQSDMERVIIVNIQSGGAGLSLHDLNGRFPRVAIICPSWSCFDMQQATGRIHRAGAKSKAIQKVFFAAGTIEEDVCSRVREKLKNMAALNDADLSPKGIF